MKAEITKREVDRLVPGQGITDNRVPGFQARCLPSGTVQFSYRFKLPGKPQKAIPIGLHGELTVDQARKLALDHAYARRHGRDPAAERKVATARSENTVNAVLDNYLKRDVRVRGLKSETAIVSMFDRYVRPSSRHAADIRPEKI